MKSSNISINKWLTNKTSTIYDIGVKAEINESDRYYAIKVKNHNSLFSIISKIRRQYKFTVKNNPDKNEYIIFIHKE